MPSSAIDTGALAQPVRAELARRRLLDFCRLVYPRFETPAHLRLIADKLEQIERGEMRRLGITVPVRHGKSVISSQCFPSWYIGRHPDRNVVIASHAEDLAVRNSRVAKHLLEDDRWPFPNVSLSSDSTAAGRWNTTAGGGLYAIGVGGAITGRGADLLVIDDALHDGLSKTASESVYRWFVEVAFPRLEPGGAVVVIGARFASDDLVGRILESEDGSNWNVVSLPAIAEDGDPLGRAPGEALWPERMDLSELAVRRVAMGSRAFESQFQQRPTSALGGIFRRAWFANRYDRIPTDEPHRDWSGSTIRPRPNLRVLSVDCASRTGVGNDFSALATITTDRRDYFIEDIVAERLEFNDLSRRIVERFEYFKPRLVVIESASSGIAVEQSLKATTRLPIVGVTPKSSKEARAEGISPLFEAGRVKLPQHGAWIDPFIDECCAFPFGAHDDRVDAVVHGLVFLNAAVVQEALAWKMAAGGSWNDGRYSIGSIR